MEKRFCFCFVLTKMFTDLRTQNTTKMFQLKKRYRDIIRDDPMLQACIAKACGKTNPITVRRWAVDNNQLLTLYASVYALQQYLKLEHSEAVIERA